MMFVGVAALQFGLFYHFAVVDLNKEVIFLMLDFLSLYHSFKIVFFKLCMYHGQSAIL